MNVTAIPLGALGSVSKGLIRELESWKSKDVLRLFKQQHCLRSARIMRRVQESSGDSDFSEGLSANVYVSRKEGGRGLASIEDSVDASIQRLEDYIEKHDGGLITAIRNDTDNTMDHRMTITRKQKWAEKQHCGGFKRLINNKHLTRENLNVAKKRKL